MISTKEIRSALKETLGYNSKQVTVKESPCGYSTALTFTIRAEGIFAPEIKKFAEKYSCISRCAYTDEILSGGNTFVNVEYSAEVYGQITRKYTPMIKQAASKLQGNTLESIGDTGFLLGVARFNSSNAFALWGKLPGKCCGFIINGSVDRIAIEIAENLN